MKILKLASVLIIALMFSNCSNDDDRNDEETLSGMWKLIEVKGSIAGTNDTFEPGLITWNFNPSTQTFTVVNKNTDEEARDIFESGTYPYKVVTSPIANSTCNKSIELNSANFGCITIIQSTLQINDGAADGEILNFIR